MDWYLQALGKYATFGGRARRKEYWFFLLVNVLVSIALVMVDVVLGTFEEVTGTGLVGKLYALAVLLPSLAVTVRRLHDTDRSGWWVLIGLVPLLGAVVLLVFTLLDSQPGSNRFGPNPKSGAPGVGALEIRP